MGKEFIEYQRKTIPYNATTLCFCLTNYAKDYIKEKRNVFANVKEHVRNAVLVDSINYLGSIGGAIFGLYTKDLYTNKCREAEEVDVECLLTVLKNHYAKYIFEYGIIGSVLRNNHMNECTKEFDVNDGAKVLVDFINYIAEVNGYDRKFTIRELYEVNKNQIYKLEMAKLKEFLQKSSDYCERIVCGADIESIYISILYEYNVEKITKDGEYYSFDQTEETRSWVKRQIEESIYALAYAYAKMNSEAKEPTKIEMLDAKILEMKNSKQKEF